jgi:hypothetical protein
VVLAQKTGRLSSNYHLGLVLDPDTQQYTWRDSTLAGNGEVSNSNPCAPSC